MKTLSWQPLMLISLLLLTATPNAAFARGYTLNDDYRLEKAEEDGQLSTVLTVQNAMKVPAHNPQVGRLQTQLAQLEKQRQEITAKILDARKRELGHSQTINVLKRQKRNNGYKITELEIKLQRME